MNIQEVRKFDKNIQLFVDTIYGNFMNLADIEKLKHNKKEINRLLRDKDFFGLLVYDKSILVAYLLGEFKTLPDSREIYYITYIYVGTKYRNKGLGTKLMNYIVKKCKEHDIQCISLICDTEDNKVYDFYLFKGFMPDPLFRTYDKYELLSLYL